MVQDFGHLPQPPPCGVTAHGQQGVRGMGFYGAVLKSCKITSINNEANLTTMTYKFRRDSYNTCTQHPNPVDAEMAERGAAMR